MRYNTEDAVIIYTSGMESFAQRVERHLHGKIDEFDRKNYHFGKVVTKRFSCKEIKPRVVPNVRGRRVFVLHDFEDKKGEYDPNYGNMELFLLANALKYASAREVTYILPHLPYQRQDRIDEPHVPISIKVFFDLLERATDRPLTIVTFDMHAGQIQGMANFPIDNLPASPLFAEYSRRYYSGKNIVVASPDVGGASRVRALAKQMGRQIALCDKRREEDGKPEIIYVVGDVKGKDVEFFDDIGDTAGTINEASNAVRKNGANDGIIAYFTHGLFSFNEDTGRAAEDVIREARVEVVTTDTIPRKREYYQKNGDWLKGVISVAPMVSKAIYEIETNGSISSLFDAASKNPSDFFELLYP